MYKIKINGKELEKDELLFLDSNIWIYCYKYKNYKYDKIEEQKRRIEFLKLGIKNCKIELKYLKRMHDNLLKFKIDGLVKEINNLEIIYNNLYEQSEYTKIEKENLEIEKENLMKEKIECDKIIIENSKKLKNSDGFNNPVMRRNGIISEFIIEYFSENIKLTRTVFNESMIHLGNILMKELFKSALQKAIELVISDDDIDKNDTDLDQKLKNAYATIYESNRDKFISLIYKKRNSFRNVRSNWKRRKFIEVHDDIDIKLFDKISENLKHISSNDENEFRRNFEINDQVIELTRKYIKYNGKNDKKILSQAIKAFKNHPKTLITNDGDLLVLGKELEKFDIRFRITSLDDIEIIEYP